MKKENQHQPSLLEKARIKELDKIKQIKVVEHETIKKI